MNHFNSFMVQLKVNGFSTGKGYMVDFNSFMVQLKGNYS